MAKQAKALRGVVPMLYAVFNDAGTLDRAAFRRQIEAVLAAGASSAAILGLITEVSTLSPQERQRLVDWAVEDIGGRASLVVTISGSNVVEARRLARGAEAAGADGLFIQPPLGARPNEAELSEFFAEVMDAVTLPTGIQNAPEYLGVGLSAESVRALAARRPHFRIMKGEGPVAVVKPYIDRLGDGMAVFNGRGGLELPDNLRAGCAGMVPAPDCADIQLDIYAAFQAGDFERMDSLYREILPYVVFAMQTISIAIVYGKFLFAHRAGIDSACACRVAPGARDPFFEAAAQRWSRGFGPYRSNGAAAPGGIPA